MRAENAWREAGGTGRDGANQKTRVDCIIPHTLNHRDAAFLAKARCIDLIYHNSSTIAAAAAVWRASRMIATVVPWGPLDTSTRASSWRASASTMLVPKPGCVRS